MDPFVIAKNLPRPKHGPPDIFFIQKLIWMVTSYGPGLKISQRKMLSPYHYRVDVFQGMGCGDR